MRPSTAGVQLVNNCFSFPLALLPPTKVCLLSASCRAMSILSRSPLIFRSLMSKAKVSSSLKDCRERKERKFCSLLMKVRYSTVIVSFTLFSRRDGILSCIGRWNMQGSALYSTESGYTQNSWRGRIDK